MVNRVLIRIKVVQILYSYLLTRSEFSINEAPESASRDKRYAHSVYIDMLLLLLELSGYSVRTGESSLPITVPKKLSANKVARALIANDTIKTIMLRGNMRIEEFDPILQALNDKIAESKVYLDYAKKSKTELGDDVTLWVAILETIIARDPQVEAALRQSEEFTVQGFQRGISEACNTLKSYADSREMLNKAKKDLETSLDKAYELYLSLFALIIDITKEQERRIDVARTKHLASSDDLNPNTKLIDNKLVEYLQNHQQLNELFKEYKVQRSDELSSPVVRQLLDKILNSQIYADYLQEEKQTLEGDAEFWRNVMKDIILPSEEMAEELEDKSVYWNDDLDIMGTFALKSLRYIGKSHGDEVEFLPKFKDEEDASFGAELFKYAIDNQEEYRNFIDKFILKSRWDPERIAYMDIVIMTVAIAEIIHYPQIPVPVSINEYVDIANGYSTDKSGGFINGILFSIVNYLNEQGVIQKKC